MPEYDPTPCTERRARDALHMTVAVVLLTFDGDTLQVLMVEDQSESSGGRLALPTAYVRNDQQIDEAARDLLFHEVRFDDAHTEQFYTFSAPYRDEEARTMCCAYIGAASPGELAFTAMINDKSLIDVRLDEVHEAQLSTGGLPVRAVMDHAGIIAEALLYLRRHLASSPLPWRMLPEHFVLSEVLDIHEAILGKPVTAPFFRKAIVKRTLPDGGRLVPTGRYTEGAAHRPAQIYYIERRSRHDPRVIPRGIERSDSTASGRVRGRSGSSRFR